MVKRCFRARKILFSVVEDKKGFKRRQMPRHLKWDFTYCWTVERWIFITLSAFNSQHSIVSWIEKVEWLKNCMSGIAWVICIKLKTSILFYYSVRGILRFLVSQVFCFFLLLNCWTLIFHRLVCIQHSTVNSSTVTKNGKIGWLAFLILCIISLVFCVRHAVFWLMSVCFSRLLAFKIRHKWTK